MCSRSGALSPVCSQQEDQLGVKLAAAALPPEEDHR